MNAAALRAQYGLAPHIVATDNPAREQEWNELARLFVQRFQQLHGLAHDSLAGPQTFRALEASTHRGQP